MTSSEWIDQVDRLREAPLDQPSQNVRVKWVRRSLTDWRGSPVQVALGVGSETRIRVYLFAAVPDPSDPPLAVAILPDDSTVSTLVQGSLVNVRGWPKPGGAVAIEIEGTLVRALGPCGYSNSRKDRWGALP